MRIASFVLSLIIPLGIVLPVQAEQVLYCQEELATEFYKKENGSWVTGKFETTRLTIKFNDDYTKVQGIDNAPPWNCFASWLGTKPEFVVCSNPYHSGHTFIYNKSKRRFNRSFASTFGYVGDDAHNYDSDTLTAGTCTQF